MFVYFDKNIQKTIPCTIIPNKIIIKDDISERKYYCRVSYDDTILNKFNVSRLQILKYSNNIIDIHELYSYDTQIEIDYYNSCLSDKIVNKEYELNRYEKIYEAISNVDEISTGLLYSLCNLIINDLQFKYLEHEGRVFMISLSDVVYTTAPTVYAPHFVRMINNLFNKYTGSLFVSHTLDNYNKFEEYDFLFPITLNVENIRNNINLIMTNPI